MPFERSVPASPPEEAVLDVVPDPEGDAAALAIASLRRERFAEHEEMWAQLFVDGVFEDVVRALRVETEDPNESSFLARFRIAAIYRDGTSHRAQVRFVRAVSRIVPKGMGGAFGTSMIQTPEAIAEMDFVAHAVRARAH
ncbi:MAG TPA: hypothetical protein VIF62_09140 [Labilithrix sp.]